MNTKQGAVGDLQHFEASCILACIRHQISAHPEAAPHQLQPVACYLLFCCAQSITQLLEKKKLHSKLKKKKSL
jgi:hypothetical protein